MKIYTVTADYGNTTPFSGRYYEFNSLCDTGNTVFGDRLSAELMVDLLNQLNQSTDLDDIDTASYFNLHGDAELVKFTVTEMEVL